MPFPMGVSRNQRTPENDTFFDAIYLFFNLLQATGYMILFILTVMVFPPTVIRPLS